MRSDIEEEMRVLGGGVLGPVWSRERHDQQHWFPGEPALGRSQEGYGVVSYQVRVVILK